MMNESDEHAMLVSETTLALVVERLCTPESYASISHRTHHDAPMPSGAVLAEIIEALRGVIFPGYFGTSELRPETMHFQVGATLEKTWLLLSEQIERGFCFACETPQTQEPRGCRERAHQLTTRFLAALPGLRQLLASDVQAAFEGDPAARSPGETIFCYPSIRAMVNHRIAHELWKLGVPVIPRIISEQAHGATGIDIHPGAEIGERFFMDHGTGIVIGETAVIGRNVRLYQGVTLGARSFPLDKDGKPIKGIPRHPIIEDDVIIYAGATLLGRIRIGRGAVIGGNVWLTHDVEPGRRILQSKPAETVHEDGSGI